MNLLQHVTIPKKLVTLPKIKDVTIAKNPVATPECQIRFLIRWPRSVQEMAKGNFTLILDFVEVCCKNSHLKHLEFCAKEIGIDFENT